MVITKDSPNVQCDRPGLYHYQGDIITDGCLRVELPHLAVKGKVSAGCGISAIGDLTVEGNIETNDELLSAGAVYCCGNIHAGAIRVGGRLMSDGEITATFGIAAAHAIEAKKRIVAGDNICSGGQIRAGGSIASGRGVCSEHQIVAGEYILSGAGIVAGRKVVAKTYICAEGRIFAGVSAQEPTENADNRIVCEQLKKGAIAHGKLILTDIKHETFD